MVCQYMLISNLKSCKEVCRVKWDSFGTVTSVYKAKTPNLPSAFTDCMFFTNVVTACFFLLSHANWFGTVDYILPSVKNCWVENHQFVKQHKLPIVYFFYQFLSNFVLRNNSGLEIPKWNLVAI